MRRLLLLALLPALVSCPGLGKILRQYGYTEIRPASLFFAPGTLVWVEKAEPFVARVLCRQDQVMGPDFEPAESPTMNAEISRAAKKGATLDADIANLVRAGTDLHAIKSVKMTLRNARLFEVSDYDIETRLHNQDAYCKRLIQRRRRQGYVVTMITSSLQADVTYTVNWDDAAKLDASGKVATLENLALQMGLESSRVGTKTIDAKGLYWGIRDDQYLAKLYAPDMMPNVDRGSRVISADQVPMILAGVDSPTTRIRPASQYQSLPRPAPISETSEAEEAEQAPEPTSIQDQNAPADPYTASGANTQWQQDYTGSQDMSDEDWSQAPSDSEPGQDLQPEDDEDGMLPHFSDEDMDRFISENYADQGAQMNQTVHQSNTPWQPDPSAADALAQPAHGPLGEQTNDDAASMRSFGTDADDDAASMRSFGTDADDDAASIRSFGTDADDDAASIRSFGTDADDDAASIRSFGTDVDDDAASTRSPAQAAQTDAEATGDGVAEALGWDEAEPQPQSSAAYDAEATSSFLPEDAPLASFADDTDAIADVDMPTEQAAPQTSSANQTTDGDIVFRPQRSSSLPQSANASGNANKRSGRAAPPTRTPSAEAAVQQAQQQRGGNRSRPEQQGSVQQPEAAAPAGTPAYSRKGRSRPKSVPTTDAATIVPVPTQPQPSSAGQKSRGRRGRPAPGPHAPQG